MIRTITLCAAALAAGWVAGFAAAIGWAAWDAHRTVDP
jgi:hypothetical protein